MSDLPWRLNSLARECPMPPGEHLHSLASALNFSVMGFLPCNQDVSLFLGHDPNSRRSNKIPQYVGELMC